MRAEKTENKKEYNVKEAEYKENNTSVVDRLKAIKQRLDKQDQSTMKKIEKKIEIQEKKNEPVDLQELYSNLNVRPMKFINVLVDGKKILKLVIVKEPINKISKSVKNTSSK